MGLVFERLLRRDSDKIGQLTGAFAVEAPVVDQAELEALENDFGSDNSYALDVVAVRLAGVRVDDEGSA